MHPVLFRLGSILIPSYGAIGAAGVLAALFVAQGTARRSGVHPAQIWNLCVIAVFAALAGERLTLVVANWSVLQRHPGWALGLALVHHPLVTGAGALAGLIAAAWYIRIRKLPGWATADALTAPLMVGLGFEQIGALMAGAGYGVDAAAKLPWAVTYSSVYAAHWSDTPLGTPLHPVQAYAAIGFLALAVLLLAWHSWRSRAGDVAGIGLLGLGTVVYVTEIWRDPEGRGLIFHGALDGPQIVAVVFVLLGALALRERGANGSGFPLISPSAKADEEMDGARGAGR